MTSAACVLVAAALLGACGGDGDGGDSSKSGDSSADKARAKMLFASAFAANEKADSGMLAGTVDIAVKGVPRFRQPISVSLSGPFSANGAGQLPDVNFSVGLRLRDGAYGAELSAADGTVYLSLGNSGYRLPPRLQSKIASASRPGKNGLSQALRPFGVAPERWGRNPRIVGNERVGGEDVVHLRGAISVNSFLQDADRLIRLLTDFGVTKIAGLPASIPRSARAALVRSVTSARGDLYVGTEDKALRKAHLTIAMKVKQADRRLTGGVSSAKIVADLNVSELGEPQDISAPSMLRPYSEAESLLRQIGEQVALALERGGG